MVLRLNAMLYGRACSRWIWSDIIEEFWLEGAFFSFWTYIKSFPRVISSCLKMFLIIAVWFIRFTKSDFTHGISLLKNQDKSSGGTTQRSSTIITTKHQSYKDCENICNNLASKCTSYIWMKPSPGETGGHCHFMVKRDNSIKTCERSDPSLTGVLRINIAGHKKPKYTTKYICNHPEYILARSTRNSALQIEERTINFADGRIFKEPALTHISDADCATVCKYTDKCEVYNHIIFQSEKLCFLIEKPFNINVRSRCPRGKLCRTEKIRFH